MLQNIPPEITIASFSVIGVLTGYVWNDQDKRICTVEKNQKELPLVAIKEDITQIKTDIDWLKKYLIKN